SPSPPPSPTRRSSDLVPGRNAIGIELPNTRRETVYLRELMASRDFETSKHRLALSLGKTINGEPVIADLAKMPHLLVAGTTGSRSEEHTSELQSRFDL